MGLSVLPSSAATSVYPTACSTGAIIVMKGATLAAPVIPPSAICLPVLMRFIGESMFWRVFRVGPWQILSRIVLASALRV